MTQICCVSNCKSNICQVPNLRLYKIPSDKTPRGRYCPVRKHRQDKWIKVLKFERLQRNTLENIRICSLHFIGGKPANLKNTKHPDWVPNKNLGTLRKRKFSDISLRKGIRSNLRVPARTLSKNKFNTKRNSGRDSYFDQFCRCCSKKGKFIKSILDFYNDEKDIKICEILTSFQIKVVENEILPTKICEKCYEEIVRAHKFQLMCKSSLEFFEKLNIEKNLDDAQPSKFSEGDSERKELAYCEKCNRSFITLERWKKHRCRVEKDSFLNSDSKSDLNFDPQSDLNSGSQPVLNSSYKIVEQIKEDHAYVDPNVYILHKKYGKIKQNFERNNENFESHKEEPNELEEIFEEQSRKLKLPQEKLKKDKRKFAFENKEEILNKREKFLKNDLSFKGDENIKLDFKEYSEETHTDMKNEKGGKLKESNSKHLKLEITKNFSETKKLIPKDFCELKTVLKNHENLILIDENSLEEQDNSNSEFPEKIYTCTFCKASFSRISVYDRHILLHYKLYKCEICGSSYNNEGSLFIHKYFHDGICEHNSERRQCITCKAIYGKYTRKHVCKYCGQLFKGKNRLKMHEVYVCINNPSVKNKIKCDRCTYSYPLALYNEHKNNCMQKEALKCPRCPKEFYCNSFFKDHLKEHGKIKCDKCAKKFFTAEEFEKHKEDCNDKNSLKCPQCSKQFTVKRIFLRHVKMHKEHRPIMCDLCGKVVNSVGSFCKHKKLHMKEREQFFCSVCSKGFNAKSSLVAHMKKIHRNDKGGKEIHNDNSCESLVSFKEEAVSSN